MSCDLQDLTCNHGIKSTSGPCWYTQRIPRALVMQETVIPPALSDGYTPRTILSTWHTFLLQPDNNPLGKEHSYPHFTDQKTE